MLSLVKTKDKILPLKSLQHVIWDDRYAKKEWEENL